MFTLAINFEIKFDIFNFIEKSNIESVNYFIIVYCILFLIPILPFFCFHLGLLINNTTTVEFCKRHLWKDRNDFFK